MAFIRRLTLCKAHATTIFDNVPLKELGAKAETDDTKSETKMTDFTMFIQFYG
jgi:hypothetical protein